MENQKTVKVRYLKSNSYRTVHSDGANGGLTPDLNLYVAFWAQRSPLPDATIHSISHAGTFEGVPIEVVGVTGVIREVECGVMMNLEVARNLYSWLGDRIKESEIIKAGLTDRKEEV